MKNVRSLDDRRQRVQWDGSPIIRFLSESHRRPLFIRIDSEHIAKLVAVSQDATAEIVKEIALWRCALGRREIAQLEVRYCDQQLPAHDITRLIHRMASEFEISSCDYRVVLKHDNTEDSVLALFKGLRFSQCQFEIPDVSTTNWQRLENIVCAARKFRFDKIGVQILYSDEVSALTNTIRELQHSVAPDYILVGTNACRKSSLHNTFGVTLLQDELINKELDFLSLGPSAKSDFQGQPLDTLSDVKRYASALANKQLPVITVGYPNTQPPS